MKVFLTTAMLALALVFVACSSNAGGKASAVQTVQISVTEDGFVPASVNVQKGQPVKLVVTRKTDRTCATEVVLKDYNINKPLPLNQPVEITFTPDRAGTLQYACGMNMIKGNIVVQ